MSFFEKLMVFIFVGLAHVGVASLFYFYDSKTPDQPPPHYDMTIATTNNNSFKLGTEKLARKIKNSIVREDIINKNDYIKWEGDQNITYMDDSLRQRKYKQPSTKIQLVRKNYTHKSKIKYPMQPQKRNYLSQPEVKKRFLNKQCSYFIKMKKRIEERMRSGYRASEYNWLESKRKYWSNKYTDNCFDGYRYPK